MFTCKQQVGKDESQNPVKRGRSSARLVAMEASNAADPLTNVVGGCPVSASSQDLQGSDKVDSGRLATSTPSRPLTVQTSFPDCALPSFGPHSGSSTDTASEVASLIHSPSELSMSSNNDSMPDSRVLKSYFDEDLGDDSKVDLDSRLAEAARVLNATPNELDLLSKGEHADAADQDGTKAEHRDQKNVPRQFTAKVNITLCSLLVYLFVNNYSDVPVYEAISVKIQDNFS